MLPLFLITADPALSRFDPNMLTDQIRMEILVSSLDDESQEDFQAEEGVFSDVCEWKGVNCDPSAPDDRVIEIIFQSDMAGTMDMQYIPPGVQKFAIMWEPDLTGTLRTARFTC